MADSPTYLDLSGLTTYDGLIKAEISGKIDIGGKAGQIPFGTVDSTSTATVFTATVDGLTELVDGTTVMLKNGVVTSTSGFTLNVNNLGAKPCYNNMATGNDVTPTSPTRDTTIFNINYTMLFVYDSQLVSGGAWICYRGYDGNTNTIGYQLRTNSSNRPMADAAYRYRLYFTSADGSKWVPANTSTSTDATTSRTLNTRAIDPFGPIVYNSTNGTTNSGARPSVATLWQQYTLTIGYSYVKSLAAWDSVWLKCQPNADGSAVMKDVVQALPTSKDGYIYILLGFAYSATAIELRSEHPVYWHDGAGIRLWTGAEPSGGSTVTVTPSLTSGTQVGTISVDGTSKALYAPTPPTASTTTPSMDGTAAVGTATTYARADHVHPTDTSKQDALVSGTNIKTINGESILGSGDLTVGGGGGGGYDLVINVTLSDDGSAVVSHDADYLECMAFVRAFASGQDVRAVAYCRYTTYDDEDETTYTADAFALPLLKAYTCSYGGQYETDGGWELTFLAVTSITQSTVSGHKVSNVGARQLVVHAPNDDPELGVRVDYSVL